MPYGETWFQEGDEENNPKYNSQELDKETGFYFYNARHYDPAIARFVTADSVIPRENDTQSWNRFSYCSGNPIIYKDPSGHEGVDYNSKEDYAIKQQILDTYKYDENTKIGTAKVKYKDETIKIIFNRSDANSNSIDKITKSSPKLWRNVVEAAIDSEAAAVKVSSLNYGGDEGHGMGIAVDLKSLISKDGREYAFLRSHDNATGGWSSPNEPEIIKKFTQSFMSQQGSVFAWQPWEMRYWNEKKPMKNIIDKYPSLSKVSPINVQDKVTKRFVPSEEFKKYTMFNKINREESKHLFWDGEHSHHGHFQVGVRYRTDK